MRKIESALEIQKKEHTRNRFFTILMLLILVGSTAGYAFFSRNNQNSSPVSPGNVSTEKVYLVGNLWAMDLGGHQVLLSNSPDSVKNISVETNMTLQSYRGQPLYLAANRSDILAELSSSIGLYASRTQEACYGQCNLDVPEKNCSEQLIVWLPSQAQKVYQENRCIFIKGDLKAVDALVYKLSGI